MTDFYDKWLKKSKNPGILNLYFVYNALFITFGMELFNMMYSLFTPFVVEHITLFIDSQLSTSPQEWKVILPWLIPWCILAIIYSFTSTQKDAINYFAGCKICSGLQSVIYNKLLKLPSAINGDEASGSLVNLLMSDTREFIESAVSVHSLWSVPLNFIIGFAILFNTVGVKAALAFVVTLCVFTPLTIYFALNMKKRWGQRMSKADVRVNKITEVLENIKISKLMGWEQYDGDSVEEIRKEELKILSSYLKHRNSLVYCCNSVAIVSTFITVLVYLYTESKVDSALVIRLSLLCGVVATPLVSGSMTIVFLLQISAALKRINAFMRLPERTPYVENVDKEGTDIALSIHLQDLTYPVSHLSQISQIAVGYTPPDFTDYVDSFHLKNIDLEIKKGETVAIVGETGSGKSTLFQAILSELVPTTGSDVSIRVAGDIAYFAQGGFVFNNTVKNNITFGKQFDEERYNHVVTECCLTRDLRSWPAGDMTEIGERGSSTSGGQRARVDLARCVYSNSDILLLDDPLSAVDAHISKALMKNVILEELKDKTVLLVTHQVQMLPFVDRIIVIDNGTITYDGDYAGSIEYIPHPQNIKELDDEQEEEEEFEEKKESSTTNIASTIAREEQNTGSVKFSTYKTFFKYAKMPTRIVITAILPFVSAGLDAFSSWWLNQNVSLDASNSKLLAGYLGAVLSYLVTMTFSMYFFHATSIRVSRVINNAMMRRLLRAPISWFTSQPLGRLQNRFTSDIQMMDVRFTVSIRLILTSLAQLVVSFIMILLPTAYMLIPTTVAIVIFILILQVYRPLARDLKRCDNVLKSPVLSHTSQTLTGISTLRTYDQQLVFTENFNSRCNSSITSTWLLYAAEVWQALYLNFCAIGLQIIMYIVACCLAYYTRDKQLGDLINSLQSVSQITGALTGIAKYVATSEQAANSMERIEHYINDVPQEFALRYQTDPPKENWPLTGNLSVQKVSARYRDDLPLVIQDLSIEIKAGERIGIVGRSGAGKSTLTNLILRILECEKGKIILDGQDISKIGLHTLRDAIAVIPQDPSLNSGTLRSVLDPGHKFTEIELWEALTVCELSEYFKERSGLDTKITVGGCNLSSGQRQLLSLCRALLKNSKVICIDEATSSMSVAQDALVQQKIRSAFSHATILAVAHRINTIIDFDKILVMSPDSKYEFDSPINLYQKHGLFYSLCNSANVYPAGIEL